jgi:hypothetical protein
MDLDKKYRGSYVDGIFITEESIDEPHTELGLIQVDSKRMNSNLSELKKKLAKAAELKKADAIINYKYGQKRTLLSIWDDTKWHAEGMAIKLKIS